MIDIVQALQPIKPGAQFSVGETYETLVWLDKEQTKPTEQEFNDAVTAWSTEYDAQEYARNRASEYPSTGDQFDKIYNDGLEKWKSEMVNPVKTKWPKDNSGPV